MFFFSIVLWCVVWISYVVVAAVDINIFINYYKVIFMFMYCVVGVDFCICGVIVMVIGDGEIISEYVLVLDVIIFLLVVVSVFINMVEIDFWVKIFKIFVC